jgi:hypothetical protein
MWCRDSFSKWRASRASSRLRHSRWWSSSLALSSVILWGRPFTKIVLQPSGLAVEPEVRYIIELGYRLPQSNCHLWVQGPSTWLNKKSYWVALYHTWIPQINSGGFPRSEYLRKIRKMFGTTRYLYKSGTFPGKNDKCKVCSIKMPAAAILIFWMFSILPSLFYFWL